MVDQEPRNVRARTGSQAPVFRRVSAVAAGAALAFGAGLPAASAADSGGLSGAAQISVLPAQGDPDSFDETLLSLVNDYRSRRGLRPLSWHAGLASTAQSWSSTMAASRTLSERPDLDTQLAGAWSDLAENIALDDTAEETFADWTASPSYRANLLNPSFTSVGIGHAPSASGQYVTEDFGASAEASPATSAPAPAPTPTPTAAPGSPSPAPVPSATQPAAAPSRKPEVPGSAGTTAAPQPSAGSASTGGSAPGSPASTAPSGAGAARPAAGATPSQPSSAAAVPSPTPSSSPSATASAAPWTSGSGPAALNGSAVPGHRPTPGFVADLSRFGSIPNTVLLGIGLLGVAGASFAAWGMLRRKAAEQRMLL